MQTSHLKAEVDNARIWEDVIPHTKLERELSSVLVTADTEEDLESFNHSLTKAMSCRGKRKMRKVPCFIAWSIQHLRRRVDVVSSHTVHGIDAS